MKTTMVTVTGVLAFALAARAADWQISALVPLDSFPPVEGCPAACGRRKTDLPTGSRSAI